MRLYLRVCFCTILFLSCGALWAAQEKSNAPKEDDQIYAVGGDVKPPKIVHYVEPDTSSQEGYVEGIVKLSAIVNVDGVPSNILVVKGLNEGEDKLALEALKQWRFSPGTKSGRPVRVKINVEINFHLL